MPLPSSRKAGLRAGRQMQVESTKSRLRGRPRAFHLPFRQAILCRERFQTVPYSVRCNDEGRGVSLRRIRSNSRFAREMVSGPEHPADERFSAAC